MPELIPTPGQTVGPFFHCALPYPGDSQLIGAAHDRAVRLHGTVYDGVGHGVPDALVELWQTGPSGDIVQQPGSLRRDGATFTGWGRSATDAAGHYGFTTLAPGPRAAGRPAFFTMTVFARGLLDRLFTRAYLPHGDLEGEPVLSTIDVARKGTLICVTDSSGYRFDIHLQGPNETVFLRYRGDHR